ncbi:MAG: hypothetical protein IPN36_16690 [Bacteroidetes bacterium]|nr:hypothetical protein [Bacteroidota bacterium]
MSRRLDIDALLTLANLHKGKSSTEVKSLLTAILQKKFNNYITFQKRDYMTF